AESSSRPSPVPSRPPPIPWFQDVSHLLNHSSPTEPASDHPPLWCEKMDDRAPLLACIDLDTDGWEDLCVGTNCFRNDRKGGFVPFSHAPPRVEGVELPAAIREKYRGFWRAAAMGDFDRDGRPDFVG